MRGLGWTFGIALALVLGLGLYALSCSSEFESNDTIPDADLIGTVPDEACGEGTIDPAGDLDVWYFELAEAGSVIVETSGWYDGDTVIGLADVDGNVIATDDDSGEDLFSRIDLVASGRVLAPGYYLVLVRDVYVEFSSGKPYAVTVTAVASGPKPTTPPATDVSLLPLLDVRISARLGLTGRGTIDFGVSSDPAWCPLVETAGGFAASGEQEIPTDSPLETRTIWRRVEGVLSDDRTMLIRLTAAYGSIYENEDTREMATNEITLRDVPLTGPGLRVVLGPADLKRCLVSYTYDFHDEMRPWILSSYSEKDVDFTSDDTRLEISFPTER